MSVRDFFEVFSLSPKLALDPKELEKKFYALSRQFHPDLQARKSPEERASAEDIAAVLNDAYRTLKEPIARASYLLRREGFDASEQSTKDVPPELLEEVFELNMALEELKAGDADALPQLAAALQRFEGMCGEIDSELHLYFAAWDADPQRETLAKIRALLNRRKYVTNLIAQAQQAITTHVPD